MDQLHFTTKLSQLLTLAVLWPGKKHTPSIPINLHEWLWVNVLDNIPLSLRYAILQIVEYKN